MTAPSPPDVPHQCAYRHLSTPEKRLSNCETSTSVSFLTSGSILTIWRPLRASRDAAEGWFGQQGQFVVSPNAESTRLDNPGMTPQNMTRPYWRHPCTSIENCAAEDHRESKARALARSFA